jgi:hypothetical protein
VRGEEGALGVVRFTLNEGKGEIAAKDYAARFGDALMEARRYRADAGDRQDAERDAGDENAKAAQATAQIAPGESHCKSAWAPGRVG